MTRIPLSSDDCYTPLVMLLNDIVDCIDLDLDALRSNGYAVVDENAVHDYCMNLEWFDYSNDDCEEMCYCYVESSDTFVQLERIVCDIIGFEVKVESMRDGLYIWDWHRYDVDEVLSIAA